MLHGATNAGLHGSTQGYIEVRRVTWGYTGLHTATQGYMGIHRIAWGYTRLHIGVHTVT